MNEEVKQNRVINGVEIIEDGDVTHFVPVKEEKKIEPLVDNRGWLQRLIDWWNDAPVKPYVKVRDPSNPVGINNGEDHGSKQLGAEVGIRIDF